MTPQLAVVLINFSLDNTSQPFTPTAVANSLFNNPSSVAAYYAEQSYGQTMLTGTVSAGPRSPRRASTATRTSSCGPAQARAKVGSAIDAYSNVSKTNRNQ